MEGRRIFAELTVDENLRTGAYTRKGKAEVAEGYARVLDLFPILKDRRSSTAGYLSGGEQQMVAMGRALMADPEAAAARRAVARAGPEDRRADPRHHRRGQRPGRQRPARRAERADGPRHRRPGYVMETGRIVKEGAAAALLADEDIKEFYLGISADAERKSFRDVKSYRRKKRWAA
jgi:branched-chain amino acid transport system ATP-binding protein